MPVGETLADHGRQCALESKPVAQAAVVESPRLLVQVAKQVKLSHGNVGAADRPLEERPEVFKAVGVDAHRPRTASAWSPRGGSTAGKAMRRTGRRQYRSAPPRSTFEIDVRAERVCLRCSAQRSRETGSGCRPGCAASSPCTIVLPTAPRPLISRSRRPLCILPARATDERLVALDFAAELAEGPVRMANRIRWSINQAVGCRTPRPGDSSRLLMPFFALAIHQTATNHLSRPSGLSSKIVPTLTENCLRQPLDLHCNSDRERTTPTPRCRTWGSTLCRPATSPKASSQNRPSDRCSGGRPQAEFAGCLSRWKSPVIPELRSAQGRYRTSQPALRGQP